MALCSSNKYIHVKFNYAIELHYAFVQQQCKKNMSQTSKHLIVSFDTWKKKNDTFGLLWGEIFSKHGIHRFNTSRIRRIQSFF